MDLETAAQAYHNEPTRERAAAVVRAGEALVTSIVNGTPSHPIYGEWGERFCVGLAALYEALMRWSPDVGNGSFASFAYMRVRGAVLTYLNRALDARRDETSFRWGDLASLDAPNDERGATLYDLLPASDGRLRTRRELREHVLGALPVLTEKQRDAVLRYYYLNEDQAAQAENEGVRQHAIHYRLKGAYERLGHVLDPIYH